MHGVLPPVSEHLGGDRGYKITSIILRGPSIQVWGQTGSDWLADY